MIRIALVYGRAGESDGVRRLVDRGWLRSLRKHAAHLERWASGQRPRLA